ncbi:hypothetical protein OIU34_29005 [Pararhizobium sp. BT-229]|uniref:hypothetical protein n=1 Tax=Pararhizobium sp. BT-229 TaxID=2986923 RepID=UPI0021F69D70|nr:hypothetical protein [Pararhizobium sp. BT-229]MCV9965914.1 hypothetical protein [Pararhizobium sp. BT-229]
MKNLRQNGWNKLRTIKRLIVDSCLRMVTAVRWSSRQNLRREGHGLPGQLVVSLTSYPPRFPTLSLTLKTLLTQQIEPNSVILWIAHEDRAALPSEVLELTKHGLEIKFCDDMRSYKKIVPLMQEDRELFVVTADDDVYYGSDWLKGFTKAFDAGRWEVICYRAHLIQLDKTGLPLDYNKWDFNIDRETVSDLVFPTGIGGILYRPGILHTDVTDHERFTYLCPSTDDIWLYFMARRTGATWRKIGRRRKFRPWLGTQDVALMDMNLHGGENDRQIRNMLKIDGFSRISP